MNRGVGVLNEARQQADEHGSGLGLGELFGHYRDGRGRGDFAEIHAAYAVGNRKQIAVGTGLVARRRDKRSHRVFIVGSNLAEIACLTELNIQHGRRGLTLFSHPGRGSVLRTLLEPTGENCRSCGWLADKTQPYRFDKNQGEKRRTQIDIDRSQQASEAMRAQVFSDVDTAHELVRSNCGAA